jgi:WS/DGAT C-terminal domain
MRCRPSHIQLAHSISTGGVAGAAGTHRRSAATGHSLHPVVGPDRTLALIRGSLQQSKDVVATCDATVNVKTRAISRETAQRKMRVRPSLGSLPRRIASRALLVLVKRQRVNVDSTDIFGPEVPLYLAGARLLEMFPMVQLLRTVTLAVGGMSYAGQFNAMVVADAQGYPDIDIFTRCAQQELRTLAEVLRPLRTSRTSAT